MDGGNAGLGAGEDVVHGKHTSARVSTERSEEPRNYQRRDV